jgi:hypothetical protein
MLNAPKTQKLVKMDLKVDSTLKARLDMLLMFQKQQRHPLTVDEAIKAMLTHMVDTLPELADFREYETTQDNA